MGDDPRVKELTELLRQANLEIATKAAALAAQEAELAAQKAALAAEILKRDDDNGFGYLQDKGLPPIQTSTASVSTPSYGTHLPINGQMSTTIGIVAITSGYEITNLPKSVSSIWRAAVVKGGKRQLGTWNHESFIENWIRMVLDDIAVMIGVDKQLSINSEISLTLIEHLIPDILIFRISGTLVGVCEVKRPTFDKDDLGGEVNVNLINQIHNYLKQMQYVHGVRTPIGIISTYRQWRICWLPEAKV